MAEKTKGVCVLTGFVYRGEAIHTVATGQVVIFPSWLGGKVRAKFETKGEAMSFVDAHIAVVEVSSVMCQVMA
jgi:hypothetical protein